MLRTRSYLWILIFILSNIQPSNPGYATTSPPNREAMDEICDNGLDDDMDGLIDLNDPDCICPVVAPSSYFPNPSFEVMECCPEERDMLECATGWQRASAPTTDYLHTCGWFGWNGTGQFDNFSVPLPIPDGHGVVGFRDGTASSNNPRPNWKEYAGACLPTPLEPGSLYRLEFELGFADPETSPPIAMTLFGTTSCINMPFGPDGEEELIGCPTNTTRWYKLGHVKLDGGSGHRWVSGAIQFTPAENTYAIAFGPPCEISRARVNTYYFLDNLILDKKETFDLRIQQVSVPCAADFELGVHLVSESASCQWYKDGIALLNETEPRLYTYYGPGDYQLRVTQDDECSLSQRFTMKQPYVYTTLDQTICTGETYPFGGRLLDRAGIYRDTVETIGLCDSIFQLQLRVKEQQRDTIQINLFPDEHITMGSERIDSEGEYLINLATEDGCDSIIQLTVHTMRTFIPTAFSPNDDGINDVFRVESAPDRVRQVQMTIYDRWGSAIHSGPEWEGTSNDRFVTPGIYVYMIHVTFTTGRSYTYTGDVLLVR